MSGIGCIPDRRAKPNGPKLTENMHNESPDDVNDRLLKDRIILVSTPIDDEAANVTIAKLLFLEAEDAFQDINLYINCPGGAVTAALAIYDTMSSIRPDVTTICIGKAAGIAVLLVAAGAGGKRFALPNASFKFISFRSDEDSHADLKKLNELQRLERLVVEEFKKHLRCSAAELHNAFAHERFFTASQAIRFGIIDAIVRKPRD